MADSIWPTVHAERAALADDVAGLTDEQWATRSLGTEWNVHQTLAHLVFAANMTPPKFLAKFAGAGCKFNRFTAAEVARNSTGSPAATVGSGPVAEGPAMSLLLAASGRRSGVDELSGPGADVLRQRL